VPDENSHGDLLRTYLSGAGSDGGAQADPDASIGEYRSATEARQVGFQVEESIPGVRVTAASGEQSLGGGNLVALQGDYLRWSDPDVGDGSPTAVKIANGETKVVAGALPGAFLRVQRTTSSDLRGSMSIRILELFNGLFDDVPHAERLAGDTEYRCVVFRAGPDGNVADLKVWLGLLGAAGAVDSSGYAASGAVTVTSKTIILDWPATGYVKNETTGEVLYYSSRTELALTVPAGGRSVWGGGASAGSEDDVLSPIAGLALGLEAPSSQPDGTFDNPADEDTAPSGVTFYAPTSETDSDVLEVPTLGAGEIYGLWIAREVPAAASAEPWARFAIEWSFVAIG
jgi:hypothetical protein